ncbi:hypothetical protein Tco_1502027 [Tanacetum coccineum]
MPCSRPIWKWKRSCVQQCDIDPVSIIGEQLDANELIIREGTKKKIPTPVVIGTFKQKLLGLEDFVGSSLRNAFNNFWSFILGLLAKSDVSVEVEDEKALRAYMLGVGDALELRQIGVDGKNHVLDEGHSLLCSIPTISMPYLFYDIASYSKLLELGVELSNLVFQHIVPVLFEIHWTPFLCKLCHFSVVLDILVKRFQEKLSVFPNLAKTLFKSSV